MPSNNKPTLVSESKLRCDRRIAERNDCKIYASIKLNEEFLNDRVIANISNREIK